MYTIYPYLSNKRVINFGLKEVRILLSEPTPLFDQFDEKIREKLESFGMCTFLMKFSYF